MLVLLAEQRFFPEKLLLLRYLLISVMIVVLIYTTVLVKKTTASYITCVVFMSITVSHAADVNPCLLYTSTGRSPCRSPGPPPWRTLFAPAIW